MSPRIAGNVDGQRSPRASFRPTSAVDRMRLKSFGPVSCGRHPSPRSPVRSHPARRRAGEHVDRRVAATRRPHASTLARRARACHVRAKVRGDSRGQRPKATPSSERRAIRERPLQGSVAVVAMGEARPKLPFEGEGTRQRDAPRGPAARQAEPVAAPTGDAVSYRGSPI